MSPFNRTAASYAYDSWYESKIGAFADQVETQLAFDLFKPEKFKRVLEVGCGTGNFSLKLARMGLQVTAVDKAEQMLKIAEKKAKKEGLPIDFFNMDVYQMKFEDNYFDGVFSMAMFEYIYEPERALQEMFRVVKKGGKILIGTINKESKWGELYLGKKAQGNSIYKYASLKTGDELRKWNPEKLKAMGQCLFLPPETPEEEIGTDLEKKLSSSEKGGFICALWIK